MLFYVRAIKNIGVSRAIGICLSNAV